MFLFVIALALGGGPVNEFTPVSGEPRLRVALLTSQDASLAVDGETVEADLAFGGSVGYMRLSPGDHELTVTAVDGGATLLDQTVSLDRGFVGTALVYPSDGSTSLSVIDDNVAPTSERSGRVMVFNAYTEPVSLVDSGNATDTEDTVSLLSDIPADTQSAALEVPEDTSLQTWAIVDQNQNVLAPLRNQEVFKVARDTLTLLIVAPDQRFPDVTRAVALPLIAPVAPPFGSPVDVGELLFSRYMLPMQAVAFLLLVAMVGAIVLTHKPREFGCTGSCPAGTPPRQPSADQRDRIAGGAGRDSGTWQPAGTAPGGSR